MKAPNNKVSIIFVIAVLIVTSTITYSNYQKKNNTSETPTQQKELIANIDLNQNTQTDSDGDGLLDWEEILWGTDSNNPDSDNDGTLDGEEVDNNRNPLISGPNDENIDFEDKIIKKIEDKSYKTDGLTNKIAVNFVETYFQLRGNEDLNDISKDQLINQITQETANSITLEDRYLNIQTFDSSKNPDKLIDYANNFFGSQADIINTINILAVNPNYAVQGEALSQLSLNIVNIETPLTVAKDQLGLANQYHNLGQIVKNFQNEKDDPLAAMVNLRLYQETQNQIEIINNNIGLFLSSSGIIYEDNEFKLNND
jgi:hypothetical protein